MICAIQTAVANSERMKATRYKIYTEYCIAFVLSIAVASKLLTLGGDAYGLMARNAVFPFLSNKSVQWWAVVAETACVFLLVRSSDAAPLAIARVGLTGLLGCTFLYFHAFLALRGSQPCACFGSVLLELGMSRNDYTAIAVSAALLMVAYSICASMTDKLRCAAPGSRTVSLAKE